MTVEVEEVELENGTRATGVLVHLFNAPLILVKAPTGYVMCGYLDMGTAERMGDACAIVRGVATLEALLEGRVVEVSVKAGALGVIEGMTGKEAVNKMIWDQDHTTSREPPPGAVKPCKSY